MFEAAEIGQKVNKSEYKEQVPGLRQNFLDLQQRLRRADFPVIVLFAAGTRGQVFRLAGMITVVVVVAKLLLFDLSRLDQLVRVGIFACFGGVLLLVSYFFPSLWRRDGGEMDAGPGDDDPSAHASAPHADAGTGRKPDVNDA